MKIQIKTETMRQISEVLRREGLGLELADAFDLHIAERHGLLLKVLLDFLSGETSEDFLRAIVAVENLTVIALDFPEI